MIRRAVVAIFLCAIATTQTASAQDFPKFTDHVVDVADVVPDAEEEQINGELASFQERTEVQVAVAVIDSTGNASLEDYSNDLFEEWGVGDAENDDGVLLLIAMDDRKLRIETGFGVEDDLTDLESGRIIRDIIVPLMREGSVGNAILQGTRAIRGAFGDTVAVQMPENDGPDGPSVNIGSWFWLIPFFIFGPLSAIGRRGRRRRGWITPVLWGGGFGGGGGGFGGGGGGFGGGGGGSSGGGGASGGW